MSDEEKAELEELYENSEWWHNRFNAVDGETYKPLKPTTQEVFVRFEETEPTNKYNFDFTQPIEISVRLTRKKKGTLIERCLYYQKSKKKRIRKKYNLLRILGDIENESR